MKWLITAFRISALVMLVSGCTPMEAGLWGASRAGRTMAPLEVKGHLKSAARELGHLADMDSFSGIFMRFDSGGFGNFHSIPIGDYLLSKMLFIIPEGKNVRSISLRYFDGRCKGETGFSPHAICNANTYVQITTYKEEMILKASVYNMDVGNIRVGFFTDSYIRKQVKGVIDSLAEQLDLEFSRRL